MQTDVPGGDQFPELAQLLAAYFHQDYMLDSTNFEEIIDDFSRQASAEERDRVIRDIHCFIDQYGATDQSLRDAMDRVFFPSIIVEGWNGLTTRQWLLRVAEIIERAEAQL